MTGTAAASSFTYTRPEAHKAMVTFFGGTGWHAGTSGGFPTRVKKKLAPAHDCLEVTGATPYVACGLVWTTRLLGKQYRGLPDWVCRHVVRYGAFPGLGGMVQVYPVDDTCRIPTSWPDEAGN